jgi:hypothetical protein
MAFSKNTLSCSGHSGPRLLLIAAAEPLPTRFIGTITSEKRKRRTRSVDLRADDQSDPGNCHAISSTTITRVTWMILRTIPDRALGFARLTAHQAGVAVPGFQIHLNFVFCSRWLDFSVLRESPMGNGWKKAAIGLSALLPSSSWSWSRSSAALPYS